MGKIFAALIIAGLFAWLVPMCARLPSEPLRAAAPMAAPQLIVPAAPEPPAPAPLALPVPAPAAAPRLKGGDVTVRTYRMKKGFEESNSRYFVHVIRANRAEVPALGVRMKLVTRMKGKVVEQSESGSQTLAPGTTAYAGLSVSTVLIDQILDGPEDAGTELEWTITYRLEGDAPGARRCYVLRALPRRREPEGVVWLPRGDSAACEEPAKNP